MRRLPWPYVACLVLLLAATLASICLGTEHLPPGRVLQAFLSIASPAGDLPPEATADVTIVRDIRLPRTALFLLVGCALGASGAAYQGILRNPLADPYLIGVAPGAALGAAIAIVLVGPSTILGCLTVPLCAFLGALLTVLLVYRIARVRGATPVTTLILAGVAVGAFASAASSFVMLLERDRVVPVVSFLSGGFGLGGWLPVLAAAPYILPAAAALTILSPPLNALQFGDEQASQLGIPVGRVRLLVIAAATVAVAAAVAFTGIIGFVGLIVPHVLRLLVGPDYRRLVPLSALGGAALLLGADAMQRSIPLLRSTNVGVLTALLGAPCFLILLRRDEEAHW